MPSFKSGSAVPNGPVQVSSYVPQNLDAERNAQPVERFDFLDRQDRAGGSNFQIDQNISNYIGLTDAKNREQKKQFDAEVMRYVQKIKDEAFKEAYEAGLRQGVEEAKAEAYQAAQAELDSKTQALVEIVTTLSDYREKMIEANEKEIIEFSYLMAKKIVFKELKQDPSLVLEAIKAIVTHKESITVKLSDADYDYVQGTLQAMSDQMDTSRIRFEKESSLSGGDVIVESEQGTVDGTVQTRLEKLKLLLDGKE